MYKRQVHDVLHQEHVPTAQIDIDVEEDPNPPHGFLGGAVRTDGHQMGFERQLDLSHQVREEHRAALEHRDQDGLTPHVVPGDRAAELVHPAADVLAPEQHASELRHRIRRLASARRRAGRRGSSSTLPERSRDDGRDGS